MEITDFAKGSMWGMPGDRFDILYRKFIEYQANADLIKLAVTGADNQDEEDYRIIDRVAVIPISGLITKNVSFWSWLFPGSSITGITELLQTAITDPKVDAILLNIDSPGGTVNGTNALSEAIFEARNEKPIIAYASMMASAAYWIGCGANYVFADKTADIGSIGVLMVHTEYSKHYENEGVKTTYLTAGKYKAIGNDSEPLSELAKETFRKELDYVYGIFIDTVAKNRGVAADFVKNNMADGRIFIGEQAVTAGLVDMVASIDDALWYAKQIAKKKQLLTAGGLSSWKGVSNV